MAFYEFNKLPVHFIDIKDIDSRPGGPFCMSFGRESGALIRSIETAGLINTPVLLERKNKKFIIVVGFRRVLAAKSLGWGEIACRILPESHVSPLNCLLINLHDNLATREINEVEKGMILSRLSSYLSHEDILQHYMPLLGLPRHMPTLHFFIKMEEIEMQIREHLVSGRISIDAVKALFDMDTNTRSAVTDLIVNLKLNINQQKQLINFLTDISYSKKISICRILKRDDVLEVISNTRLNRPQKAKALLNLLREERFPTLTRAEKIFREMVSSLDLPKGMRICAPQYFEAPGYSLHVAFRDGKELKHKIEMLSRKEGLMDLSDPWKREGELLED